MASDERDKHGSHFYSEIERALALIKPLNGRNLRLIIHAGTPKTGTTSLQAYLSKKQRRLRSKGILYPHNLEKLQNPSAPRHQWFEKNLVATHEDYFLENFKNILSQVDDETHTIIISSEGIYNYWWDFSDQSKALLDALIQLFDVRVWVWFREPLAFIESYYKQCIRNPQIAGNECYGKDLSFAQMLDVDWFAQHLNYQGFMHDCCELFGDVNVSSFSYDGDTVQQVKEMLGMATPFDNPSPRQNESLSSLAIELLRVINRQNLKPKDKDKLIQPLKEMNEIFKVYDTTSLMDADSRERILEMYRPILR